MEAIADRLYIAGAEIGFLLFSAIGLSTTATVFGTTLTWATLVGTIALTGVAVGLQLLLAPKATQPELPAGQQGTLAIRQPVAPRSFGWGRARIAGAYVCFEESHGVSVDVIALMQGRIRGIVDVYLFDDRVIVGRFYGALGPYLVYTSEGTPDARYHDEQVMIDTRLGLPTETSYSDIIVDYCNAISAFIGAQILETKWSDDHRGDGVASLLLVCAQGDRELFTGHFPAGKPEPSAVADLLPVWDFRDPAQSATDKATWTNYAAWNSATNYEAGARVLYVHVQTEGPAPTELALRHDGTVYISAGDDNIGNNPEENPSWWIPVFQNPVLQLVNYLTDTDYGMGESVDEMIVPVLDALIVQANLCDVLVEKKDGFEARYRSSGWAFYDTDPQAVLGAILSTCDGWMSENATGSLALHVGWFAEWWEGSPKVTIGKEHIFGVHIDHGVDDEQAINVLDWTWTNPANDYKHDFPGAVWEDEDDIAERGVRRTQTAQLPWVQSHSQGRRLIKRKFVRNNSIRCSVTTDLFGMQALGERWLIIQDDRIAELADAVVEVQGVEVDILKARMTFKLLLVDPDTVDAWDPDLEEGDEPPAPDKIVPNPPPIPTGFGGFLTEDSGGDVTANLYWDDVGAASYRVRYREADFADATPWTEVDPLEVAFDGAKWVTAFLLPALSVPIWEFQVAGVTKEGVSSQWSASLYLTLDGPSLDHQLPQNSQYLMMGWI